MTLVHLTKNTSLVKDVLPFIQKQLDDPGYTLLRMEQNGYSESQTERTLVAVLAIIGQAFAKSFAQHLLEGYGSQEVLPVHTEGIYDPQGLVPLFAFACIRPSVTGGQTRIFDARTAAKRLLAIKPEYKDVVVRYGSSSYPNSSAEHALVQNYNGADVLRYRTKTTHNTIVTPTIGDEMYATVDACVECSLVCAHAWSAGDVIFVNNMITLHDRLPYTGTRKMLRMRFNEHNNRAITY